MLNVRCAELVSPPEPVGVSVRRCRARRSGKWARALRGLVVISGVLGTVSLHAADLTAYAESLPPYSFLENGVPAGLSTEVLRAVCAEARLDCEIHIVPWARAYALASQRPNCLAYTMVRLKSREPLFDWVGPLPAAELQHLFTLSESPIQNLQASDLARFRIGAERQGAGGQRLIELGVPAAQIDYADGAESSVRKFLNGRVQLIVGAEKTLAMELRRQGRSPGEVRAVYTLPGNESYYFALNRGSTPGLAGRLQAALDALRARGVVDTIAARYRDPG